MRYIKLTGIQEHLLRIALDHLTSLVNSEEEVPNAVVTREYILANIKELKDKLKDEN